VSTPPLFLVDALPTGDQAVLGGPEGRHAAAVRRLRAGEELMLGDGRGALAHCVVEQAGRDHLDLRLLRRWSEPQQQPRVLIVQALVKGDRGELAVELATEAGADGVVPWQAERCVVRWDDGPRGAKALARWRSTAREAAKQARRSRVPEINKPVGLSALAELVTGSAAAVVLEAGAAARLADLRLPDRGDLAVIVGPEGGISDTEIEALTAAGAQVARLGTTVLRASTAAVVALGALGVITERWR
jgi:16S rRNA (uracil1498-N3)-methyltransferase